MVSKGRLSSPKQVEMGSRKQPPHPYENRLWKAGYGGLPANNVRLIVRGSQVALGVNQVKFKTVTISQIRELAGALVDRMLKYVQNVASDYPADLADGEYMINLATRSLHRCDS